MEKQLQDLESTLNYLEIKVDRINEAMKALGEAFKDLKKLGEAKSEVIEKTIIGCMSLSSRIEALENSVKELESKSKQGDK